MQDGASAHTSNAILGNDEKRIEGYIREKNITLLTWPPKSPDMNLSK
jgi:transposase